MNLQHERIRALCQDLKLERVEAEWPHQAQQAAGQAQAVVPAARARCPDRTQSPDPTEDGESAGGQDT